MLVPTNLSKKERAEYDKKHIQPPPEKINKGPKAGLRPVGGDKKEEKKSGTKTFGKR